jgi:hypothetical protein
LKALDARTKLYTAGLVAYFAALAVTADHLYANDWTARHHAAEILYPAASAALIGFVVGMLGWLDPRKAEGFLAPGSALVLLLTSLLSLIPSIVVIFNDVPAVQASAQFFLIPTAAAAVAIMVGGLLWRA